MWVLSSGGSSSLERVKASLNACDKLVDIFKFSSEEDLKRVFLLSVLLWFLFCDIFLRTFDVCLLFQEK